jgi:predicted transcriptional regulator
MIFDISGEGLLTLFKPYQAALMEHIWELNNPCRTGITSGQAYEFLQNHPDSKSRASVINFLNEMVEEGILTYEEKTGKGGYHRV